jgi:hypothetical protein
VINLERVCTGGTIALRRKIIQSPTPFPKFHKKARAAFRMQFSLLFSSLVLILLVSVIHSVPVTITSVREMSEFQLATRYLECVAFNDLLEEDMGGDSMCLDKIDEMNNDLALIMSEKERRKQAFIETLPASKSKKRSRPSERTSQTKMMKKKKVSFSAEARPDAKVEFAFL